MQASKTAIKDPVCGMTVDAATSIRSERDGKTFYFCSEGCKKKFLSAPVESTYAQQCLPEDGCA